MLEWCSSLLADGVSCDSCSKRNFRGRRYKCLVCYDYDLCSSCYETGATTPHHTTGHPMQCILTRSDFELYYGGESLTVEQPQSFTCPHCGRMGLTETTLQEHVTLDHMVTTAEVVCPVCASLPGGDPNLMTDDLSGHLNLEHRSGPRDLISFLDEPASLRHGGVRRGPHASRGVGGPRPRRCNMHFSTGGLSSISPSTRDTVDPIAELLSQLSGVRRSTASTSAQSSTPSQLQQLQMQLQLERQQAARQQLERLPRRQAQTSTSNAASGTAAAPTASAAAVVSASSASSNGELGSSTPTAPVNLQFLLSRCTEPPLTEAELQAAEQERADHSLFVQELVMSTLSDSTASILSLGQNAVAPNRNSENSETSSSRESPGGGGGARVQSSPPSSAPSTGSSSSSSSVPASSQQRAATGAVAAKRSSTRGVGPVTASSGSSRNQAQAAQAAQAQSQQVAQPQQQPLHLRDRGAVMSLQNQPSQQPPQPMRVVTGTGTIREVVAAPSYGSPGSSRRKPVRTATEPPPPH
ncbi:E3 ubiquitin-protein ligase KCMF1-like isoform X2 [Thrips palmi]|uniref:RING-type E3 ubiquitin transferase n=1 Tax=Thrips palmi TaxID=161013 RepID=A0A6P8YYN1_THRPL|nr:E3 ubiquitin-protein ligase KCMF1-like isoform X2 [Thrips palmi]